MTSDHRAKVKEIFFAAIELEGEERAAYVERACDGDADLQRELLSLLAHDHDNEDAFGEKELNAVRDAVAEVVGTGETDDAAPMALSEAAIPEYIGRYKVLRKIGEGGMGLVYEATQEQPSRRVALKVIRPGLASRQLLRRFQHEAEVLGQLQHPGIAHVYDAGTAELEAADGSKVSQPYFAMEFVQGLSLHEYAAAHQLGTRQRLDLVAKVCGAVHHAHQKGVIHRDLKPSNIIVDAAGQPKILDFGVARATDADTRTVTMQTDVGQLVGTIPYMSPEQVLGDSRELDTRADVYALGVVIYELLSGRLPYDVRHQSIPEAARIIREEEPSRLSSINTVFRGDVETIVAKALEKEKDRRYQSAAELGADIERYLHDEPIVARPASSMYQLGKFAKRNKALVGGVVAVVAALIAGVIGTGIGLARAKRAEQLARDRLRDALAAQSLAEQRQQEAEQQSNIARAVNEFVNDDLLAAVSPQNTPNRAITMREVLDSASQRVKGAFDNQPVVASAVHLTLGTTYLNLGEYGAARPHLEQSVALREANLGEEDPATLESMSQLASLCNKEGRYEEAEAMLKTTLQAQRRILGEEHPSTLQTATGLGSVYLSQGRYDKAEALYLDNLEAALRVFGPEDERALQPMNNLGAMYADQGRYDEAASLLLKALDVEKRVLGKEHPATLTAMLNLSTMLYTQGKYAEATPLMTETLAVQRRVLGDEHPDTLRAMNALAAVLSGQGRHEEALPLQKEALEIQRRTLGEEHADTLRSMNTLAGLYLSLERYDEAEPLYVASLEARMRVLGKDHMETVISQATLGALYNKQGRFAEAEPLLARAVEVARQRLPARHYYRGAFLRYYGLCLSGLERFEEAEAALLESYDILSSGLGPTHAQTVGTIKHLRDLYEAWDKPAKADTWRAKLPDNASE